MKKLTELVKQCRQEMIDAAGGDKSMYEEYMEEARQRQADVDRATAAIILFAGLPEEQQARERLEIAEGEVLIFRAMIYRLYNEI